MKQPILYSAMDKEGELRFAFRPFDDQRGASGDKVERKHRFRIAWVPWVPFAYSIARAYKSCRGVDGSIPATLRSIYLPGREDTKFYGVALCDDDGPVGQPQPNHDAMIRWLLGETK